MLTQGREIGKSDWHVRVRQAPVTAGGILRSWKFRHVGIWRCANVTVRIPRLQFLDISICIDQIVSFANNFKQSPCLGSCCWELHALHRPATKKRPQ